MNTSQEPSLIRRSNQQRKNENENLEGLDKPKEANYKYPKANVPLPETKSKRSGAYHNKCGHTFKMKHRENDNLL